MTNEEANKVLEEMHQVRPEKLNDKAKRLFEAIMKIADGRDKAESDLYEANNRINDLLDIAKQKDKEIEELKGNDLRKDELVANMSTRHFHDREKIRKYEELQDKIKAKVIEIKNRPVKDEFITATQGKLNTIIEIESLLEKE